LHYVDLYQRYLGSRGTKRQRAVEELLRFAYRIRFTNMVYTKAIPRVLAKKDKSVAIPPAVWNDSKKESVWKSSKQFTYEQLANYIRDGLEHYPLSDSNDVVDQVQP